MLTGLFIGVSFSRWMSHRFGLGRADHVVLVVLTVFANILSAGFGMITYYVFINVALLTILGCFFNLDVTQSRSGRLFFYIIIGFALSTVAFVSVPFALANLVISFTLTGFFTKKKGDSMPAVGAAQLLGGVLGN
jgi:hypothetical protein